MGWSGGTFTRVHDWTDDEAGGIDILSTRMDEEDDNFEAGINACLTKDGSNSPSANLPMGGMVHTGVGTGTERDSYASIAQVQDGKFKYNSAFNNLNAYTLVLSPAPTGYAAGQQFNFKPANSNSGATTLNVNSLGPKNVYSNGAPCAGGEIVGGRIYSVIYDGTQFQLVSGGGSGGGVSYGGARIHLTSDQPLYNRTWATVTFRTMEYDSSSYYTAGTDYLKIPVTGRYRVTAGIVLEFNSAHDHLGAFLSAVFKRNGSILKAPAFGSYAPGSGSIGDYLLPGGNLCWEGALTANDQITLYLKQWNGAGSDFYISGEDTLPTSATWMAIERIY
jgi:hypothetical protein